MLFESATLLSGGLCTSMNSKVMLAAN